MARCALDGGWQLRVPGLVPGELRKVRITHVSGGGKVLWGAAEDPSPSSPLRRNPPCVHHGSCGACGLQHVEDGAQLRLKVESFLGELPAQLGSVLADPTQWIPSPEPFGSRHKAVFLPSVEGGRLLLGGYARGTHDVIDLPSCEVLTEPLRRTRVLLIERLEDLVVSGRLPLRSVVARANREGEVLATLVLREAHDLEELERLAETACGEDSPISGLHLQLHPEPGDAVTGRGPVRRLAGAEFLHEEVAGLALRLDPLAFFQVNPAVLEQILQRLVALLAQHPRWPASPFHLVDLYCGGGVLGLACAAGRPGIQLKGIDVHEGSITAARDNAARAGIENASFQAGRVAGLLGELNLGSADALILDPPRAGMTEDVRRLVVEAGPDRIIYVSCSTASLARDAGALLDGGYSAELLVPADMMPQTPHVEWVASFVRGEATASSD